MSQSTMNTPEMLPRSVASSTTLVDGGRCEATILYPSSDPRFRDLARALADAIEQTTGARPEQIATDDALPTRSATLPDRLRANPLIMLGSINNNRALFPLYANFLCMTDARYPGADGYDLRTIVNPYGTRQNVILAGGSTIEGVARAVDRLTAVVRGSGTAGQLTLLFLLEVELEPELARLLADWPETPLDVPLPTTAEGMKKALGFNVELLRVAGAYGVMYGLTGDRRYGVYARECLRTLNQYMTDSYGDWHYRAERILRALPWLAAGGLLDADDLLRIDQLLFGTALGTQDMWWRRKSGGVPLGHRHHCNGTYEFLLIARYLDQQAKPNNAVRALCARWIDECHAYLDDFAQARVDDQDDETALNVTRTLFRYTLGEERLDFFENGSARLSAERALAIHDSMGAGAGWGGYGEAQGGMVYVQQDATTAVGACALYYGDGRLKWILEHMPNLEMPLHYMFLDYAPPFVCQFAVGSELPAVQPDDLAGIHVIPAAPHQLRINNYPPERIEDLGHTVNAPETWQLAAGVRPNTLADERAFDKLVLRGGFEPDAPYLLIQGYQGGYRWQGHMHAANCIVRFTQAGHAFLVQNTGKQTGYHKNGVFISDGFNTAPLPPFAEWVADGTFERVGLTATRLSDVHGADWTRHIFWSRPGDGFFVVIDAIEARADTPLSLTCTWRAPTFARLDGHGWQVDQGAHRFTLRAGEVIDSTSEEELDQGGTRPYVLRQRKAGDFHAGEIVSFHNLFYVRPRAAAEDINLARIDAQQAVVTCAGRPVAWCGAGVTETPAFSAQAASLWLSTDDFAAAAATRVALGAVRIESDHPLGLRIDLESGEIALRIDGPGASTAQVEAYIGDRAATLRVDGSATLPLTSDEIEPLRMSLRAWLAGLDTALPEPPRSEEAPPDGWSSAWTFDPGTRVPERIRALTVEATPKPCDGFPDQLIDAVLPDRRESWRQWSPAPAYDITLELDPPRQVEEVRVVGDSADDPTLLRMFSPLPDGIEATVTAPDGARSVLLPASKHGFVRFKRYRDMEDRMDARFLPVGQMARRIDLHVPAPDDGRALVLHELEVFGDGRTAPALTHLVAADVDGDGRSEIVLANAADELIVLDADGGERWRQTMPAPVTHVSCHDLDGSGKAAICLGILGGELRVLAADGETRICTPLAEQFHARTDAYFGWLNTIHTIQVWNRAPDGRAALAVGGYSVVVFLDPDGTILGHSWFDGSWVTDLLVAPSGDIWARCGWNHGIGYYGAAPGLAPSGESLSFGGVIQPMFRGLHRMIPFVTGKTVAFNWLPGERILAVADSGMGVLKQNIWQWKIEGGTPIAGSATDGTQVVVGGLDGFVAAFAATDGHPLRRRWLGAPVVGVALADGGGLTAATRAGVYSLDAGWNVTAFHPLPARGLRALADGGALALCEDNTLQLLRGANEL